MRVVNRVAVGLLVVAGMLVGCGAPPSGVCTPDVVEVCTCAGGGRGTQTCDASGSGYGACVCGGGGCEVTGCNPGFRCGASRACELDPSAFWVVTASRGSVAERDCAGAAWDALGGLPDALVCLTANGSRQCTASAPDTLSPAWNTVFPGVTASMLQAGVPFELLDEDVSSDDAICNGTLAFTEQDFAAGARRVDCLCTGQSSPMASVFFTLVPR